MKQTPFRCWTAPVQPSELDKTPIGKIGHTTVLGVLLGGKKEELHSLFHPDLRHAPHFFIVKDAAAQSAKFGKLRWDIVMLEPMLHEK